MRRPPTYVTDLAHFLDARGQLVDGAAGKLGSYLGLIVEYGSIMRVGEGGRVPMRCANPSRRRRCGGWLRIGRPSRERIDWACPACQASGVIDGWRGSPFDLREPRATPDYDETAAAVVLNEERAAMRRLGGGTPALRRLLLATTDYGDGYLMFSADHAELVALRDLAREAADRARGPDRRLLDRFATRMDAARMTLPEFVEPWEPELDLAAVREAGTPAEVIAIARELAAADGRDQLRPEDLAGARSEYERGRRPVLH